MKKFVSALVVAFALVAGGFAVYSVQKSGRAPAAPLAAAGYLPEETLVLLALPNPEATAKAWTTTDLCKIFAEPEVRSFLEKPLSKLPAMLPPYQIPAGTLDALAKVNPKNLFVALTALNEQNEPHLVAGFQFQGPSSGVDQLLAPVKEMIHKEMPAGKSDLVAYQGHSIETYDASAGAEFESRNKLASVYLNDWYFISNDLVALKACIDRFDHRAPGSVALDHEQDFQAVTAKLPGAYESLIFLRAQPFLKKAFDMQAATGQPADPEAVAEAEKMRAFGATTSIENGKLRDSMYSLAPGLKQPAALQMSSMPLTSVDTLFYAAGVLNLPEHFKAPSMPNTAGIAVPGLQMINGFFAQLQGSAGTYDAFVAAFGKECGVDLEWPENSAQPTLVLSLDVKDQAAAEKLVTSLTSTPIGDAVWQVKKTAKLGLPLHTLTIPNMDSIRPALLVTPKLAILGLSAESVEQKAEDAAGATHPNVTQSETYKAAAAELTEPNIAFGYLDSRAFFERVYGIAKPAAMLGAAFFLPQANDYVDLAKLPAAEVISKHLSPTFFSETMDGQGALMESEGTVTMGQGVFLLTAAATAAAVPFIEAQMPALLQGIAPSATPSAVTPAPAPGPLPPNPAPTAPAALASPQGGGNQ
jgi:hypothetical protein